MTKIESKGADFDTAYKIYKPEQIVHILEKAKEGGQVVDFEWLKRGDEYYEVFIIKTAKGDTKKIYFNVTDLLNLY